MFTEFSSPGGDMYMDATDNGYSSTPVIGGLRVEEPNKTPSRSFTPTRTLATTPSRVILNNSIHTSKVTTIYDQISDWFDSEIDRRRLRGSLFFASISAIAFFVCYLLCKINIFSPFSSIYGVTASFTTLSSYLLILLSGFVYFVYSNIFLRCFYKVDQDEKLSPLKFETWVACALTLSVNYFISFLLIKNVNLTESGLMALVLYLSVTIAGVGTVLRGDYQLLFSGNAVQMSFWNSIISMFAIRGETVLVHSLKAATKTIAAALVLGFVLGPFLFGFSSILVFFHPSLYQILFGVTVFHIMIGKALTRIVKSIVLQPIAFPLPPAYVVSSPTPEQTRNLINVIESQHKLLKLFAFFDLRRIGWNDSKRRLEVFSLSQPGGHPRNWSALSSACLRVLEEAKSEIEIALSRYTGSFDDNEDEDAIDREMLLMPMKARKQLYSSAIRQRHRVALRPAVSKPSVFKSKKWIVENDAPLIPDYNLQLSTLAVEGFFKLVVKSFSEDRFGMVLKDLNIIIRSLCSLIQTIDKYFRARATVPHDGVSVEGVHKLNLTLQSALIHIHNEFGNHLKDIGLSPRELECMKMICEMEWSKVSNSSI
ncbi:unnamed protein product [Auanema sp. JU1783]|nr:unnamed protein product [Auanema sp. JU1783]